MKNPISKIDIQEHLKNTIFGILNEEALIRICQVARVEHFNIATLLCSAGEHPTYLRLVINGHIETIFRTASGDELIFSHISPGGWASWLSCYMEQPPDHDLYSSRDACFIALPVTAVKNFIDRYPQIYPLIIREIGRRTRLLMEWAGRSVMIEPLQRMAKLVELLGREQQSKTNCVTLYITQDRLANLARCSRQTANKLLSILEQDGLIISKYGQFEIPDILKLSSFTEEIDLSKNNV